MVAELFDKIYSVADYSTLERILCSSGYELMRSKQKFDPMSVTGKTVHRDIATQQVSQTLQRLYSYHKLKLPVQSGQVSLKNISYQGEMNTEQFLRYSCTNLDDDYSYNLVLLNDGATRLVDVYGMPKKQLVAILQFSPKDCGLSYVTGNPEPITVKGIDWIDFFVAGCCQNCKELVFIPPVPEGVSTLREAFIGCIKLNCPIFLPSTIKDCTDMLKGCDSFRSKIVLPYNLQIDDVQGLNMYTQFVVREGCADDNAKN